MNKSDELFCELYDTNNLSKLKKEFPFDEMIYNDNVIDEESSDSNRWHDFVTTVFKMENRYFAFDWLRGKTEIQDDDFDYTEYYEVVPKTKTITITEYVPKE